MPETLKRDKALTDEDCKLIAIGGTHFAANSIGVPSSTSQIGTHELSGAAVIHAIFPLRC